ncbi:MAG: cupin domain-containing protein [Phycisphaerales bacterium]|nr:cupin domain-containing protein [Phycisphaerales bacterium]
MNVIDLSEHLSRISDHWSPHIIAALNGQHVKLARIKGEFPMHAHPEADELFLVLDGSMQLEFETHTQDVAQGQLIVVPRGVRHRPLAEEECCILLFEPEGTVNTGDAPADHTTTTGLSLH